MERDWNDFKALHGGLAGAREKFESACETVFRKKFFDKHVSQVAVNRGDNGIDIFIGEFSSEPITVIQCKFFLDSFGESQHSQITGSFNTSINSTLYELKEWILCLPRVIDISENTWWFKWKTKKLKEYSKPNSFIQLINGNALIDLMKEHGVYNTIFKIDDSIRIQEIHEALLPKQFVRQNIAQPNVVLFNNYTSKCESFYLPREQDLDFSRKISSSNVWIYGKSGFGKTALLFRNLIKTQTDYLFCDLSPVVISGYLDVLEEVICSIEDNFSLERNQKEKNKIKQITQLLNASKRNKVVIIIDELSTSDQQVLEDIASIIIKLVTHFSNTSEKDELRFVISTINEPSEIIIQKSKALDHFQYLRCDEWTYENTSKLIDIICSGLELKIDEAAKSIIISNSNFSPRIIKNIIRKLYQQQNTSLDIVQNTIETTLSEIVD